MYNPGKVLNSMLMLAVIIILNGCTTTDKLKAYNVVVEIDENSFRLTDKNNLVPSIECDIIGVSGTDLKQWENYPVDEYFRVNSIKRRDANKITFSFDDKDTKTKTLRSSDDLWNVWKTNNISNIVVMADLAKDPSMTDSYDSRRKILSVMRSAWIGDEIKLMIKASGLECTTAANTKK